MINNPLISIVIPSYNKVKYIKQTLESIVTQKYQNFEVIIQDGGSTDGTLKIIKDYTFLYPGKITYDSKKDNGQLDAINTGLKKAKGEIVTFINADDVYEPGAFEAVVAALSEFPEALWFAGKGKVINEKGEEIAGPVTGYKNMLLKINRYPLLLMTNYLMQPSVFLKKKAYQKYGPFTGTSDFVMEYDLWLKIGKISMPQTINKYLSKFRIEPLSKTARMTRKLLAEDMKVLKRYTVNRWLLLLHSIHNLARILVGNYI